MSLFACVGKFWTRSAQNQQPGQKVTVHINMRRFTFVYLLRYYPKANTKNAKIAKNAKNASALEVIFNSCTL